MSKNDNQSGGFMRVKVQTIGEGLHPSEVVVQVQTESGPENLVVNKRAIQKDSVAVGMPLQQNKEMVLVELPREAMSGRWRVWVPRDALTKEKIPA